MWGGGFSPPSRFAPAREALVGTQASRAGESVEAPSGGRVLGQGAGRARHVAPAPMPQRRPKTLPPSRRPHCPPRPAPPPRLAGQRRRRRRAARVGPAQPGGQCVCGQLCVPPVGGVGSGGGCYGLPTLRGWRCGSLQTVPPALAGVFRGLVCDAGGQPPTSLRPAAPRRQLATLTLPVPFCCPPAWLQPARHTRPLPAAAALSPLSSGAPTRAPCWPPRPRTTSWRCGTWRWSGTQVGGRRLATTATQPAGGVGRCGGRTAPRAPCRQAPRPLSPRAAEEEAALAPETNALAPDNLPPQLLFVHGGQTDMKEMHWHPQVGRGGQPCTQGWGGRAWRRAGWGRCVTRPSAAANSSLSSLLPFVQINGMMVSTAADGINIFKPYNV